MWADSRWTELKRDARMKDKDSVSGGIEHE